MQAVLFTDLRHIQCGHLKWFSPEGQHRDVTNPPEPPVAAYAVPQMVARGVRLQAQTAGKTEPLPKGEQDILIALGANANQTGSPRKAASPSLNKVLFEDGLYRSWFMAVNYPSRQDFGASLPLAVEICCVESKDGFAWKESGRCPIAVAGQSRLDGFGLLADPKAASAERYKAIWMAQPARAEQAALWEKYRQLHPRYRDCRLGPDNVWAVYAAVSPDGLQWQRIREPIMCHFTDTLTTLYYDAGIEKYVMYTRLVNQDRRWVGRAEADDFYHWGPVEPLLWPSLDDPFSSDIYTNGRTAYPGLPQYHLMFPMFYHRNTEASEVRLFSSADGVCWNQAPGGAVIAPGAPGEWDGEFITAGNGLVPLGNDRIGLLYAGTPFPHKYPRWQEVLDAGRIAWAWWPKGRLCAVVAREEGEFFTLALTPAGRELRLNARVRRGGEVRVGLIGAATGMPVSGRTIEDCDPICGDRPAHPVHWQGRTDIGAGAGEEVILRFKLRAAELFGFEWV